MLGDRLLLFDAEADARAALAACPEGHLICGQYAATVLAHILIKRGDLDGAATALSWGGFDQNEVPRSLHTANPLAIRGRLHLVRGDAVAALADFQAIADLLEPIGCRNPAISYWRSLSALALLQLGNRQKALCLAEEELELAQSWGGPAMVGRALLALGMVQGGRRGLEQLQESISLLEQSTAQYDLLQARVELGAALRRTNQRAQGRDLLRQCLDTAQRSGAGLLAERAHAELLLTGARPRRLSLSGVESLTGSERRVATLATKGMTNKEIAQSLFVTTKTVEMHLARSFSKLHIRSRTELAGALGAG
jgi:ATP/maltotriose-dependent transcriptional regulator MalT